MIHELKWDNHPVLGDLMLDFSKPNGELYNTIVLAGENGCGKTTVLSTLSTFLNLGSFEPFSHIKYSVNGVIQMLHKSSSQDAKMGFHIRKDEQSGQERSIYTNRNNSPGNIKSDEMDIRHYGCVFSKARAGFSTNKIRSTTTLQLDSDRYDDDSKEDFTSIKQLLIDLDSQDNSEWMDVTRNTTGESYESFSKRAKLTRFRDAFNSFFENISFEKINANDPIEKKIEFQKFGKQIDIDSMSTGEKQIVFRGTQLLRNSNNLRGGTILIDEPELSMHPKWQGRALSFYRGLFTYNGVQNAQMILATHSEYIIKSALNDSDNVLVIVLKNDNGTIVPTRITAPTALPTISSAEVNYNAFGVLSTDYHIQLYGYLQSKESKITIKDCDDFIVQSPFYNTSIHSKPSTNPHGTPYATLPTYIRNAIDHPDSGNTFTEDELKKSIELLIKLCCNNANSAGLTH